MKAIVCLLAFAIFAAFSYAELDKEWEDFKVTHNKTYKDAEEEEHRKGIFNETLHKIELHNKKYEAGNVTFALGLNQFADLTFEEIKALHHG